MGSVGVLCGVCLSGRRMGARLPRGETDVRARVAAGVVFWVVILCARVELLGKDGGADGGEGGDSALDVVPVVIGAIVYAYDV